MRASDARESENPIGVLDMNGDIITARTPIITNSILRLEETRYHLSLWRTLKPGSLVFSYDVDWYDGLLFMPWDDAWHALQALRRAGRAVGVAAEKVRATLEELV